MKQLSLRIAIVGLCAITACATVCRAQIDDSPVGASIGSAPSGQNTGGAASGPYAGAAAGQSTNGAASGQSTSNGIFGLDTNGSASGQDVTSGVSGNPANSGALGRDASSSDDEQQPVSTTSGQSRWTAGETSFKSNGAGWGGKKTAFEPASAKSWVSESENFAESVQPGGIWRDNVSPLPAAKRPAAQSIRIGSETTLFQGPRPMHRGISSRARRYKRPRLGITRPKQSEPGASTYHVPSSLHHGYGESTDYSGSATGSDEGAIPTPQ